MSSELAPGAPIGRWKVVSVLGRGGMGVVYRATDAAGALVAVKLLATDAGLDAQALARFEREVDNATRVRHPNVLGVLGRGKEGGRPFVVLELLPGGTLESHVRARGRMPWKEAVSYGIEVARGLGAIHATGLIHRDLKPANVLLDAAGHARIADFGLARHRATGLTVGGLTKTGELLGTFEYMAPEQCDDARAVDHRADLYALGGLVFTLLTGEAPFEGTGFELLKKHMTAKARSPRSLAGDVPPELDRLVLELLAKDPGDRPASAREVEERLGAIAHATGGGRDHGRGRMAAAVVAAALAVGGGIALATRSGAPAGPPAAPPPSPPALDTTARVFPEACRGFLASDGKTMRLAAVSGLFVGRHVCGNSMMSVSVSPDGRRAVSVGDNRSVELRDLIDRTSRPLAVPRAVHAVFVSNDLLLLGLEDHTVHLWDLASGRDVANLGTQVGGNTPLTVAASPDGKYAASAGLGGVARFDVERRDRNVQIDMSRASGCVVFFPDGKRFLAACDDGHARVYDTSTGSLVHDFVLTPQGPTNTPCVAVSADGRRVLAVSLERPNGGGTIRVFETSGELLREIPIDGYWAWGLHSAAFAKDGLAVVGVLDGAAKVHVWDVASGAETTFGTLGARNTTLAVLPGGRRVLCGDTDGTLPLVDLGEGEPADQHVRVVRSLAFTRDGARLVSSSKDGTILVWDAAGKRVASANGPDREDRLPHAVNATALVPGDTSVLAATYGELCGVSRFSLATGLRTDQGFLNADRHNVLSVAVSPDGKLAASGDDGGLVQLWDLPDGTAHGEALRIPGEQVYVASLAFSPDGRRIVASAQEGRLAVWDVTSGAPLLGPREKEHDPADELPAVFIDGRRVLVGTATGALRIVDVAKETEEDVPEPEAPSPVRALAVFALGTRALVTARDGSVRLVDLAAKKELDRLSLASARTDGESIAVAPDERSFAVGTEHGAVLRFTLDAGPPPPPVVPGTDSRPPAEAKGAFPAACRGFLAGERKVMTLAAVSGQPISQHATGGHVVSVAISPDGLRALSVGANGTVELRDLRARTSSPIAAPKALDAAFVSGERAVLALEDGTVRLWDLARHQEVVVLGNHSPGAVPLTVAASPDGARAASVGSDGVRVFELASGAAPSFIQAPHASESVAFFPDGKNVLAGWDDGHARIHDVAMGSIVHDFQLTPDGSGDTPCVAVSPDGNRVLAVSLDAQGGGATIRVFETTGRLLRSLRVEHYGTKRHHAVVFGKDGGVVAYVLEGDKKVVEGEWRIHVRDVATGAEKVLETAGGTNFSLAALPGGRAMVCGDQFGTLPSVDLDHGEVERQHVARVRQVAYTPRGDRVVSCSNDGTIRVWDAAGALVETINGPEDPERLETGMNGFALLPGGDEVLAATFRQKDALVRYSLATGARIPGFFPNADWVNVLSVAVAPDGKLAASGDDRGQVKLWDLANGSFMVDPLAIDGTARWIGHVAFSPDGERLLGSAQEGGLAVWDVRSRALLVGPVEQPHDFSLVLPAAFVDARRVLAGSANGELRVVPVGTGAEPVVIPAASPSPIRALALLAGGTRALAGSADGLIRLVDLAHASELDRLSIASFPDSVDSMAVAPDDSSFAVGTAHGAVLRFALAAAPR